jgi:hypothetical protein
LSALTDGIVDADQARNSAIPGLAARMVGLAGLTIRMRVPEPSADTGRLLAALPGLVPLGHVRQTPVQVVAIEVNPALAARRLGD